MNVTMNTNVIPNTKEISFFNPITYFLEKREIAILFPYFLFH